MRIVLFLAISLAPSALLAIEIVTTSQTRIYGAVLDVSEDSVTFLEQRQRDQPEAIKSKDADEVFRAQGDKTIVKKLTFEGIASIGGVPPETFRVIWKSNLLYRIFGEFEAGRILVTTRGSFLDQVFSVVVFVALLFVALPLALMLASWPFSGERLGLLGAIGFVFILSVLGFGFNHLSLLLAGMGGVFATSEAHVTMTVGFLLIVALFVKWGSRFQFFHGVLFCVVWGSGLYLIARITARLVGVSSTEF